MDGIDGLSGDMNMELKFWIIYWLTCSNSM